MSLTDIGSWIALGATVIGAAYQILSYHRPPGVNPVAPTSTSPHRTSRRDLIFRWLPTAIALSAVGFDYYERNGANQPLDSQAIGDYGFTPPNMYMAVNSSFLLQYAQAFKLVLAVQVRYDNIDEMSNPALDKSTEYTITGNPIVLDSVVTPATKLVFSSKNQNIVGFYLLLLPNAITPDQISTLSDVGILGGKILASRGMGVPPLTINITPSVNPPP